ncbi:MAG: addiction module protein [Burkholderiales bacterium]
MARKARGKSRVVLAPAPELMSGELPPNHVVSVTLKVGEDVEWIWTSIPGGRYVSGYRIVKASRSAPAHDLDRLWTVESEERWAAYQRGEIKALSLEEVLAKYQGN